MRHKVLVAGIGNIFFGDDAFGVEVARRLRTRPRPERVEVIDFGTRGIDLAYALQSGKYGSAILVDACPRGKSPGALFVLEPPRRPAGRNPLLSAGAHGLDPARVLEWLAGAEGTPARVRIVGCEPSPCGDPDEVRDGLSPPVAAALDPAVELVERLVEEELRARAGVDA